ncbi:ubinuclein-2 [Spea bombifrons]|uniref:ubinuclein-2 n=1 Tax=Spea bombifrons TaxID=233779 RepID=UPI00234B56D4|nr:ubinuclein-2 [Spea bombifrons]
MAEPRRVPFVSLSPMKSREAGGSLVVEHHHQRSPQNMQHSGQMSQRPPQPRPIQTAVQPQRPPPQQLTMHRSPRETHTLSTVAKDVDAVKADGHCLQKPRVTVRLEWPLSEATEEGCPEFSYPELLQNELKRRRVVTVGSVKEERAQNDPFNDDERERMEVESLAKKFEAKYGGKVRKHRKDRMQDLIDIGYGYDETDPFIDNSEAYDELVPASLTTKHGGFYINTGTLQFRPASDSENEDFVESKKHKTSKVSKLKEDDRLVKKRKRKEESAEKEKPPRKLKVSKQIGVVTFNSHKPDKKKKKHYKDSPSLAAMLRKFQKEKDAIRKKQSMTNPPTVKVVTAPPRPVTTTTTTAAAASDLSDLTLGADPMLAIFGGGSELLQEAESALEMLGDFDFDKLLDSASDSPGDSDHGENGTTGQSVNISQVQAPKQVPPIPDGLPSQLEKRIEDLRVAAKMFDEEGRKKFFTQEMNNILLDIELQLQALSPSNRNVVYGYIEAFVPCNKETLVKRLKKLHLHIQDDQLREPLQRLKMAISSVMPDQLNRYQVDCEARNQAKNAKHQGEEDRDKNPSEEEDDEKPGKRVMGPRKKFCWDDRIRNLLCNLVRIKLGCYELEPNKTQSAEDYLKAFMETEIKPLWPKGWMQLRMLFKESRSVHNHLTSAPAKKKVILAPKPKVKESSPKKEQKTSTPLPTVVRAPSLNAVTPIGGPTGSSCTFPSETICLDDSLDEDLSFKPPSLDSISEALAVLNNGANTPTSMCNIDTPTSRPRTALREEKLASIMSKLPLGGPKKTEPPHHTSSLIAGHSASQPKKAQDLAPALPTVVSGLIAGSSIQNPKVSLEALPTKLLQQGIQRSQAEVSSSTPPKVKASSATQTKAACASSSSSTPSSSSSVYLVSSSQAHVTSLSSQVQNASSLHVAKVHQHQNLQQTYVTPLQATISKSHTNPVVRLTSSPQISSTSPIVKTPEKLTIYRPPSLPSPSSSHHTSVSRTVASSTSSNLLAKNIGVQGSSSGFKSPYTMAPSPKPSTTPSSSSSSTSVSLSNTTHKLSSSSIGRPSPTASPLSAGRGFGGTQGTKNPSVLPKMTGSSPKTNTPNIRQPSPSPKTSTPSPKPQTATTPGPIIIATTNSAINVTIPRANPSFTTSRTNISGSTSSGALGASKPPAHHRLSASGSPVAVPPVQSTGTASILASTSPLTLMTSQLSATNPNVTTSSLGPFGMLGGLVPVNMPFQFPLELLGFGSDTASVVTSQGSTSTAFHHNLTQNILKGLQTPSPHTPTISHPSLPPHVQQTFADGGQSKGDSKLQRKSQ